MFVRKYLSVRARAGTSQLICYVNHLTHYCMLRGFAGGVSQHQNRIIEEFKCFFLYLYRTQKQPSRGVSRKRCVLGKGVSTLLKLHFGMDVLLYICCIFSEHLFVRTPLKGCFLEYIFKSKFLN